jgi:hypothetical protein
MKGTSENSSGDQRCVIVARRLLLFPELVEQRHARTVVAASNL